MDILVRNKVCPMFLILYAKTVYAIPTKLTCKKTMQILIGSRNILRNQCRQLGCLIYDISLLRSTCGCYHIAGWWVPLLRSSNSWGQRSWRRRWRKRCLDRVTRRHRRPVIMIADEPLISICLGVAPFLQSSVTRCRPLSYIFWWAFDFSLPLIFFF